MFACEICNSKFETSYKFSAHIRNSHKIRSITYYDTYIKSPDNGKCELCFAPTKFKNLIEGYKRFCSKKCACTLNRRELADDPERQLSFVAKVVENQTRIWAERVNDGSDTEIRRKISLTIKESNLSLTKEELVDKYGWMNKLSPEEKDAVVEDILAKSLRKWKAESTDEEKQIVINKRLETMAENGKMTPISELSDWAVYCRIVRNKTTNIYKKYKDLINPNGYSRFEYNLDHILSVFDGYRYKISPDIISSPANLQMLKASINSKKHTQSWQSPQQLYEKWQNFIQELSNQETHKSIRVTSK